uniref:Wall-associated receptor kinase galacturonan-binding domain-containing protein n=1 Tax=Nelumbo nucifera TaxID=4432 RepID=A0A822YB70_NELNU|nr:TPA_asm: hypothetical protein HUJ06_031010 [Nelumbo nucifera]
MLCTLCFVACLAVAAEAAAGKHEYCAPSSCGKITNISYPFRLKGDPRLDCGDRRYELSCEDNRTVLYLHDQASLHQWFGGLINLLLLPKALFLCISGRFT